MKQHFFLIIAVFCSLTLSGCSTKQKPLVLATYTYADNNRLANLSPLSDYLEETLDFSIETKSFPDVNSLIMAIKKEEVDIAFINTFGYLLLALDNKTTIPAVALNVKNEATDNYKTVLLTRKNSELRTLDVLARDTKEFKLSLVNVGSTSGNLVPRLLLSSIGINDPESRFSQVLYAGDHTKSFQKLVDGEVDLAAVGSSEYFKQMENNPNLKDVLHPLWTSDEIPLGPVLLSNKFDTEEKNRITKLLLDLNEIRPDLIEGIKGGWSEAKQSERFIPVDDSYYDSFRKFQGKEADLMQILGRFSQ